MDTKPIPMPGVPVLDAPKFNPREGVIKDLVVKIAEAIAAFEGFYVPNSVAARHNNPGNLRKWKGFPSKNGFVEFPSVDVGFQKLKVLISQYMAGQYTGGKIPTLTEMMHKYAPSFENDTDKYVDFIAAKVGITKDETFETIVEDRIYEAFIRSQTSANPTRVSTVHQENKEIANELNGSVQVSKLSNPV